MSEDNSQDASQTYSSYIQPINNEDRHSVRTFIQLLIKEISLKDWIMLSATESEKEVTLMFKQSVLNNIITSDLNDLCEYLDIIEHLDLAEQVSSYKAAFQHMSNEIFRELMCSEIRIELPLEIQKRGKHFIEEYKKACKEGSQEINFFRLMIVGPEGVGKTSLLKALRDQPFLKEETTTDFIEKTDVTITSLDKNWNNNMNFKDKLEETRNDIIARLAVEKIKSLSESESVENSTDATAKDRFDNEEISTKKTESSSPETKQLSNEIFVPEPNPESLNTNPTVVTAKDRFDNEEIQTKETESSSPETKQLSNEIFVPEPNPESLKKNPTDVTAKDRYDNEEIQNELTGSMNSETVQDTDEDSDETFMSRLRSKETFSDPTVQTRFGNEKNRIEKNRPLAHKITLDSAGKGADLSFNFIKSVNKHWSQGDTMPTMEFFTVWDLAGQSYFFCMYSLFLSPRAVYLMPVDLSVDLEAVVDQRDRKEGRVDCRELEGKRHLDVIQYWIQTIYSVARSAVDKVSDCKSRIIIVFTKSDIVELVEDPFEKAERYFKLIKDSFACKSICLSIVDDKYHVMSAKERNSENINSLKNSIHQNGREICFDLPLPMRWLDFSLKIMYQQNPVMGEKEIARIANDTDCTKDFNDILHLFHSIGVFFFRKKLVVKSLTNLLKVIFHIVSPRTLRLTSTFEEKLEKVIRYIERVETEALITDDILDIIFANNQLTEVKAEVIKLLEEFGVILSRHRHQEYYIPYLLKGELSTIYKPESPESNELVFYIYFPDDQVPTSFHFALLSLCLQLSSSKLLGHEPKLAFNCLRFHWKNNLYCIIDFTRRQPYIRIIFQGLNYHNDETYSEIFDLLFTIQNWVVRIQRELVLSGKFAKIVLNCPCNSFAESLKPCIYLETFIKKSLDETHFFCKFEQKQFSWFFTKLRPFSFIPPGLGQKFIDNNRDKLIREMEIEPILQTLFEEDLINDEDLSKMYSLENTEKVETFLEIIPNKRKERAQRFYKVLQSKKEQNSEITSLFESFVVKSLISDQPVGETLEFSRYPIFQNPCGICLIINMEEFDHRRCDRKGANVDLDNLTETFENINFKVESYKNLEISQLEKVLDETSNLDHSKFDVFFCILMSHGYENETILTFDMEKLSKKTIWNRFNSDKCPSLAKKPKVFIVQACRGKKEDCGSKVTSKKDDTVKTQEESTLLATDADENPDPSPKENPLQQPQATSEKSEATSEKPQATSEKVAAHADLYIAQATVGGYVASRDSKKGSIFINAFCSVLKSSSYHHHFVEMMTEVRNKVSKEDLGGKIQCPEAIDRLHKKLYLL